MIHLGDAGVPDPQQTGRWRARGQVSDDDPLAPGDGDGQRDNRLGRGRRVIDGDHREADRRRAANRDDLPQVIDRPVQIASPGGGGPPGQDRHPAGPSRPTLSRTGAPMAYAMSSLRRSLSDVIAAITTMPMPRARPMTSPAAAYFTMPFVRETFVGSAGLSTTLPLIMSCMAVLAVASVGVA